MSGVMRQEPLRLPDSLRTQLFQFRRRLWTIKLLEAGCGAACGVLVAYLATFVLDRLLDTPALVRLGLFVAAVLGCAAVPLALHRWVWQRRHLEQLARLLTRRHASIGDQLLGIMELVHSESEQARSRALCEAAIAQVAVQAEGRDFRDAVPHPRHRQWASGAGLAALVALVLCGLYPAAARNAWARFLQPWESTPRYTFAMVEQLPEQLVVAYGEPFTLTVALSDETAWRPTQGAVQLPGQEPIAAELRDGRYEFSLPGLIDPLPLRVRIGDLAARVRVEPTLRPELTSIVADVALPKYLQRSKGLTKDVRGGAVTLVKGSQARFIATASRELSRASVNRQNTPPNGRKIASPAAGVEDTARLEFEWQDQFGLRGKEPFVLSVNGRDDEPPSLASENLPRQKVVLDSEQLTFKVVAQDDFGVKHVGVEWQGIDETIVEHPARGERILAAGGSDRESLELTGTFSAKSLGIAPQPIHLRLFAEDYFPGRARVYSPTYVLYVLDPQQHAIWLTEQLSKWHRQSLEVRDRELQLHETNKQLRELTAEELDQPDARRRLEAQATAERSNGRRLSGLVAAGEDLVQQAMRNPEFGVGHLEKWAEMLQILKDISDNRMPSVAELLQQAAQAPTVANGPPTRPTPAAGQVRATPQGAAGEQSPDAERAPSAAVPQIADVESSQLDLKNEADAAQPQAGQSSPRLTLPGTTLLGGAGKQSESCPAGQKVDEAITQQQDLLAEFDKIADELNRVLANLEGSTLVKRLKAASRLEYNIAGRIGDFVSDTFGALMPKASDERAKLFGDLADQQSKGSQSVSSIMDDMQAYFERRRFVQFKSVLDDMRNQDVVGSLRQIADELNKEQGLSIAQCEYWSDTLDRWAEDLVDPTSGGT